MSIEIRELILNGRVNDAIDLLNQYFPSVLSENPSGSQSERMSPNVEGGFTYVSATSVEAAHLLLNLRILAFIEACRTRPLEVPHPAKTSLESDSTSTASRSGHSTTSHPTLCTGPPAEADSEVREMDAEVLDELLRKGRKLYALVKALPNPKDREVYRQELKNVGGILGYKTPENSPVAKYLAYQRREAVADQINRAVLRESLTCFTDSVGNIFALDRTGLSPTSSIELLTRYTSVLWETAREHRVKIRPGAVIPPFTAPPAEVTRTDEPDVSVSQF